MPLIYTNPTLGEGYGGNDCLKTRYSMRREGDCHVDGVNNPTKQGLARGP